MDCGSRKSIHKIALDTDALQLLAELIGADLGRLDNELAKLALLVETGRVTADDIARSVAFQREQELKDITIELATGKPAEALRRWRQLVQVDNSAEFRAVTWLMLWLEDVGYVLAGGGAGKMSWKYRDRLPQFLRTAQSLGRAGYAGSQRLGGC